MGEIVMFFNVDWARNTTGHSCPGLSRAHESPMAQPLPDGHPRLRISSAEGDRKSIILLNNNFLTPPFGHRIRSSLSLWNSHTGPCSL